MKTILVIESSRPIEGLAGTLFQRRECVLQVASSGAEALAAAETHAPDLVIYDAEIRDFSPEDFTQALHSSEAGEVPVIVIGREEGEDDEGQLLRAGASAVLQRPTNEIDLNVKVCELLGISLRRHLRTFVKMKVDATIGASTHFATISNISLGGVLIETERDIRIGEIIKLSFFLPGDDDAITVISKVVRDTQPTSGTGKAFGCQVLDLGEGARQRIHDFVNASEGE